MHGRMSRLRRSLSRTALFGLSKSQLSLVDLPSPIDASLLVSKFSTPTTFPQLKRIVQSNNEMLREIISIFDERANLDFNYSKTLQKLSSRLHKVSSHVQGIIDDGWKIIADQFEAQATIHGNHGLAILDDIVQPLRAIFNSQYQTIRATNQLIDRELKKLNERRSELIKTKKQLYNLSQDAEKTDQLIDIDRNSNGKMSVKKRKLIDQVRKTEEIYIDELVGVEKQRRIVDCLLQKGVERLEMVEKQRLAHSQTALGRFQRKVVQFGPNINALFERQMNRLNLAINSDPTSHIRSMVPSCSAQHTVYLCDFYAENFDIAIEIERRKTSLQRAINILQAYHQQNQDTIDHRRPSKASNFTFSDFIEYLSFKVNESLSFINGTPEEPYNRFLQYQQRIIDKMGLSQSILNIPLCEENLIVRNRAPSLPGTSITDDNEYDRITANKIESETSEMTNEYESTSGERQQKQICRVLYDFSAKSEDELDVRAGDCVIVEDRLGDDWLIGHKISSSSTISKSGRFPTSYVAL